MIRWIEHSGRGPVHLFGNSLGGAVSVRVAGAAPRPGPHAHPDLAGDAVPGLPALVAGPDAAAAGRARARAARRPAAGPAGPGGDGPAGDGGLLRRPEPDLRAAAGRRRWRRSGCRYEARTTPPRTCARCAGWSAASCGRTCRGRARCGGWPRGSRAPTLVIGGRQDRLVDVRVAPQVARVIPDSRLLMLRRGRPRGADGGAPDWWPARCVGAARRSRRDAGGRRPVRPWQADRGCPGIRLGRRASAPATSARSRAARRRPGGRLAALPSVRRRRTVAVGRGAGGGAPVARRCRWRWPPTRSARRRPPVGRLPCRPSPAPAAAPCDAPAVRRPAPARRRRRRRRRCCGPGPVPRPGRAPSGTTTGAAPVLGRPGALRRYRVAVETGTGEDVGRVRRGGRGGAGRPAQLDRQRPAAAAAGARRRPARLHRLPGHRRHGRADVRGRRDRHPGRRRAVHVLPGAAAR